MLIKIVGRVSEVNVKEGISYVTMLDTEQGGMFKCSLPATTGISIDQKVNLEAVCKPGIGTYGLYIKVISLVTQEKKGGD